MSTSTLSPKSNQLQGGWYRLWEATTWSRKRKKRPQKRPKKTTNCTIFRAYPVGSAPSYSPRTHQVYLQVPVCISRFPFLPYIELRIYPFYTGIEEMCNSQHTGKTGGIRWCGKLSPKRIGHLCKYGVVLQGAFG